ncbi:hypothetical protein FSARC_3257 [Fusarium sarcochroum]|uniref:AB hydrolase-1 domain-containing protein n=1 Tax=Fusarium sarcochroum TaxID=1208366 RepID=A0A8H4XC29_9HYPO|nr:hypothetical protein FSARC_3257 [Fusarium sarcochroum]
MKLHQVILILSPLALDFTEAMTVPEYAVSSNSPGLDWKKCNFGFPKKMQEMVTFPADCATLEVPLDYSGLTTSKTFDLQLFRAKATKKPFKGSVLFNPGGPGESGIQGVIELQEEFVKLLGGHYSIIGFDPRAETQTQQPNSTDASKRDYTPRLEGDSFPPGNAWPQVMKEGWEESKTAAEKCFKNQRETGRYIGTAAVARDMLRIVDALKEDGQLRYYGVSYGTALGQIFASMFPDRVGRMVLDSNLFAADWLTTSDSIGAQDTEKAFDKFLDECVAAGPKLCRLANYSGPDTKAKDIKTAVKDVFQKLMDNDPSILKGAELSKDDYPYGGASLARLLKNNMMDQLLRPSGYEKLTDLTMLVLEHKWEDDSTPDAEVPAEEPAETPWNRGSDALEGIRCSDSSFRVETPDDLYSIYQLHMSHGSFSEGDNRLKCARWRFDAVERIDTNKMRNVKTNNPILFVNSPYDPVTPLVGAWAASARFRKSRVLIHEGIGHGFIAHPSNCTNKAVRRYFDNGDMPEVGTVCKPDMTVYEYIEHTKSE